MIRRTSRPRQCPDHSLGAAAVFNQVADAAIRKRGPHRWWIDSTSAAKARRFFEQHPHCRDDSPEHRQAVAANPDACEGTAVTGAEQGGAA